MNELIEKYISLKESSLNEGLADGIEKELKDIIKDIKKGNGVDKRSMEEHTDGELLAMFLTPVFQSALFGIKDRKGFKKNFKI
jgi:hypothetical protein